MHPGLTGGIVFDTDKNKASARREVKDLIDNLPKNLGFPSISANNRNVLGLSNQSTIEFMAAGVKASKASGTLGRSLGLSYSHASEMCSWANPEGLVAYRKALSQVHPNRLYLWESTARGYNDWHTMWLEAKANDNHARCLFLGWWSKPSQRIDRSDADFLKYGAQPPTTIEQERIAEVRDRYDYKITPEQLAWIRRDSDPLAVLEEGESEVEYTADTYQLQEQPWTEDDAFQQSGATFFPPDILKDMADKYVKPPLSKYSFATFIEFIDTRVHQAPNDRMTQLKVWEEPEPMDAVYAISADPAFGSSETSDRSSLQVLRCYADGVDQVAEYAWPLVGTRQFAWCILAVCGWYANINNDVRLIVELNGPGRAVWDEILSVKRHIAGGYQPKEIDDLGLKKVFGNVKNYLYSRNDSLNPGKALQWSTNPGTGPSSKIRVMERLRDAVSTGNLRVRSIELLDEMRHVQRSGDSVGSEGAQKDDRVISMALAVRCWEDRAKPMLSAYKRTREFEYSRRMLTIQDMSSLYMKHQLEHMFTVKRQERASMKRILRLAQRGYR